MAVSLPTAADVRKVREQAAQNVAEQAEVARTPLLAVLGVGDYAVTTVSKAVSDARARADKVQSRLPKSLTTEDLRKAVADLREQAEDTYEGFAERGEKAWGRIRKQPQVKNAISTIETYTEKLDAAVDEFVDDAHDVAEKALTTVTRQTRSTGEKLARGTQTVAAEAAEVVAETAKEVSDTVAEKGEGAAATLVEVGDEAASETRSVARKTANRTAPKTPARKPATRRTSTNGSTKS